MKEKMIKSIESGQLMSERQARRTFSAYLSMVLRKLAEFDEHVDDKNRIDLTMRFLQKVISNFNNAATSITSLSQACLSLKEPYFFKKPSNKLVGKDKAAVIGKSLSEFIDQYRRETETCVPEDDEPIPKQTFDIFLANATETGADNFYCFEETFSYAT